MAPKRPQEAQGQLENDEKKQRIDSNVEALVQESALHDAADEELDRSGIPVGWAECPSMGQPIFRFIPMKVPLAPRFDDSIPKGSQFSVEDAIREANALVEKEDAPRRLKMEVAKEAFTPSVCNLVIDLTNSSNYYRMDAFIEQGLMHVKIPNRGRGEVPAPESVNDFVFTAFCHLNNFPNSYIMVHCTHGYNRTGFMIASYILRMLSDPTTKVKHVLHSFAQKRPPGIYKNYYIDFLFKYYHQQRPTDAPPPALPPWKAQASPDHGGGGDDDEDDEGGGFDDSLFCGAVGRGIKHDDPLGEAVSVSEANWVKQLLMEYILERAEDDPHKMMFPGSQPVSLARSNLDLLSQYRYWVTWKADGTRYLIFIHRTGTYLIDRSNTVTRVQMRWPTPLPKHPTQKINAPVGNFHVGTILDGEMVVDEDPGTKLRTRRFLVYDMIVLNTVKLQLTPWIDRWKYVEEGVEQPRRLEQSEMHKGKWLLGYDYGTELFRVRRKAFWPLPQAHKLIHQVIPAMSHEADGLIFQPYYQGYVALTCNELLKWKFAHLNSVDFKLVVEHCEHKSSSKGVKEGAAAAAAAAPVLKLQLLHPQGGRLAVMKDLADAKVIFPGGENPASYDKKIIECSWDPQQQAWSFMRQRTDKTLPNAVHVYELVVASIRDDIREGELLEKIDVALQGPEYDEEMGRPQRQLKN